MTELRIAHTWDGTSLGSSDRTLVTLSERGSALRVEVDAPFAGDPPPAGRGSTPRLWEHEVVELFVFGDGGLYSEVELGPHGHWLVLRFDGVRRLVDEGHALSFRVQRSAKRWTGVADLPRALLPPRPLRCNAFRIAGTGTERRYEAAVPVPGEQPDFHQPEIGIPWPLARTS